MKKITTILVGVLFSTFVFAGGTDENPSATTSVAVMKKQEGTFNLIYMGTSSSKVKVRIENAKGQVVFSETVKNQGGFMRPYNFTGLQEGDYTITITDEVGEKSEKVSYRTSTESKLVNVLKVNGENKYLLTASGKGKELLTVNIFDNANVLVHTESKTIEGNFAQVYDVSKLKSALTFEIVHENGEAKKIKY